jgi:hypothetical protein
MLVCDRTVFGAAATIPTLLQCTRAASGGVGSHDIRIKQQRLLMEQYNFRIKSFSGTLFPKYNRCRIYVGKTSWENLGSQKQSRRFDGTSGYPRQHFAGTDATGNDERVNQTRLQNPETYYRNEIVVTRIGIRSTATMMFAPPSRFLA